MLSKKRKQSNTNENTDSLLNPTNNDKTERVIFNGNGSGKCEPIISILDILVYCRHSNVSK